MTDPTPTPTGASTEVEAIRPDNSTPPAPTASELDADKRLKGAIEKVEAVNERLRKSVELNTTLVSENPDLIHKIAATDPAMADQIVEKLAGDKGLKSYKQLQEHAKLEEIKEKSPEVYEVKKEVAALTQKLTASEVKEKKSTEAEFFKEKKVVVNEYDPNYMKVQEALKTLNPELVRDDYKTALNAAYKLVFSDSPFIYQGETPTVNLGGGMSPPPLPEMRPQVSQQSSWLAQSLNDKFGYKINLNS